MLCLTCGLDDEPQETLCAGCGAHLGPVAEGQGFLPQLRALDAQAAEGALGVDEARGRLELLHQALDFMAIRWAEIEGALAALPLDEIQQGTLASFLHSGQEALLRQREQVEALDPAGGWGADTWAALEESQREILRGHEGIAFLMNHLAAAIPPTQN